MKKLFFFAAILAAPIISGLYSETDEEGKRAIEVVKGAIAPTERYIKFDADERGVGWDASRKWFDCNAGSCFEVSRNVNVLRGTEVKTVHCEWRVQLEDTDASSKVEAMNTESRLLFDTRNGGARVNARNDTAPVSQPERTLTPAELEQLRQENDAQFKQDEESHRKALEHPKPLD